MHSFTFQIHIHIHIFTSEVTCYFCYFCYRLISFLPLNPFLPFYPFTFLPLNYVATQPLLRRDVSGSASGRSHRYVGTQFRAHRQGGKRHRNTVRNPGKCTFKFVTFLPIGFGIVKFLPVCASTA